MISKQIIHEYESRLLTFLHMHIGMCSHCGQKECAQKTVSDLPQTIDKKFLYKAMESAANECAAQVSPSQPAEPYAYVLTAANGNVRLWTRNRGELPAPQAGEQVVTLYAQPAPQPAERAIENIVSVCLEITAGMCDQRNLRIAEIERLRAEMSRLQGKPAATASRTVDELRCTECDWHGQTPSNCPSCAAEVTTLLRLIPAPSVAEPAKCGTCKDEGAVYAIHTGWSDCPDCAQKPKTCLTCDGLGTVQVEVESTVQTCCGRPLSCGACCGNGVPRLDVAFDEQPCPDCTPASAEQNTCKACHGTKKLQLYRPMSQGGGVLHESPCSLCACHAAEVKP